MLHDSLQLDRKIKYSGLFIQFDCTRTTEINTTIVDGYVGLLDNLSTNSNLDFIAKLTDRVKAGLTNTKWSFTKAFGAVDSKKICQRNY